MWKPTLSIITPSYNRAAFLPTAIESVQSQSYQAVEHIVVDGNSTDGTPEVLAAYPHLVTIVEPDQGLYDAINKGIICAKGDIIGLLNSDDEYAPQVFDSVMKLFAQNQNADVVIGQAVFFDQRAEAPVGKYLPVQSKAILHHLVFQPPAINAWFFKRSVFERIGDFDMNFPIGADRDFLFRLYLAGFQSVVTEKIFYKYCMHSGSLTINLAADAKVRTMTENLRLAEKYLGQVPLGSDIWKAFLVWHDLTSIELMILFARQRRFTLCFRTIKSAIVHNPRWPLILLYQSPARLIAFIKKQRRKMT